MNNEKSPVLSYFEKNDGHVDHRCADFKNGLVFEKKDGNIDARCENVRNGKITLNLDGSTNKGCHAVREANNYKLFT
jgi:hypothetical protein